MRTQNPLGVSKFLFLFIYKSHGNYLMCSVHGVTGEFRFSAPIQRIDIFCLPTTCYWFTAIKFSIKYARRKQLCKLLTEFSVTIVNLSIWSIWNTLRPITWFIYWIIIVSQIFWWPNPSIDVCHTYLPLLWEHSL